MSQEPRVKQPLGVESLRVHPAASRTFGRELAAVQDVAARLAMLRYSDLAASSHGASCSGESGHAHPQAAHGTANTSGQCVPFDAASGAIDLLRALELLKSAACAAQARLSVGLDASVRAARASAGVPLEKRGDGVAHQVALARRESPHRGRTHLGLAKALVNEMPHTLAALEAGMLNEWRATLLVRETACLSVEDRALVDEQVCADPAVLDGMGDQTIKNRAKAASIALDPRAVVRRARRAESERSVSCRPAPDTMVYLTGLLPVAQGVSVYAALSAEADRLRATGDPRGRGQVMADTLVERVTGRSEAGAVDVSVQLIMTDRALFQGDSEAAHLTGYGTVPAQWARDLVRIGPTGATSPTNAASQDTGRRNGSAIHPTDPDELRVKPGTAPCLEDPAGLGADPEVARDPHYLPQSTAESGGGETTAEPASDDPPLHPDGLPPDPADMPPYVRVWLRRLYTEPSTGELQAMDSRSRIFPEGMRRFVAARDKTCRTPFCDAPIRHHDHVVPAAMGGATGIENAQGLCEACNYAKEADGWSAEPTAGERHAVAWTAPTGHRYTSTAPSQPGAPAPGRMNGELVLHRGRRRRTFLLQHLRTPA